MPVCPFCHQNVPDTTGHEAVPRGTVVCPHCDRTLMTWAVAPGVHRESRFGRVIRRLVLVTASLAVGATVVVLVVLFAPDPAPIRPRPIAAQAQPTREVPSPSATNRPRPSTPRTRSPPVVPGLTSADVRVNLENRGFKCRGPRQERTRVSWLCEDGSDSNVSYRVEYLGRHSTAIEYVTASVMQYGPVPSDLVAAQFLGYVATLPYRGAQPDQAREWVATNVGAFSEQRFGPATLRLSGPARGRTLSLATHDSPWME